MCCTRGKVTGIMNSVTSLPPGTQPLAVTEMSGGTDTDRVLTRSTGRMVGQRFDLSFMRPQEKGLDFISEDLEQSFWHSQTPITILIRSNRYHTRVSFLYRRLPYSSIPREWQRVEAK